MNFQTQNFNIINKPNANISNRTLNSFEELNNAINNNNDENQLFKKNVFSSYLLSIYDHINNKFITLCLFNDNLSNIPVEISENLAKNLISFYPKNYDISLYIKPDFIFKPSEIWEVEFDEIVESDLFMTNIDLEDTSFINKKTQSNFPSNKQKVKKNKRENLFFIGKTIKSVRFISKKDYLDINEVTTLEKFKEIYDNYNKNDFDNN